MKQKTNFLVELVVGDDFSSDETLNIIKEYSSSYNVHIKILNRKIEEQYWKMRQEKGRLYNFTNIIQNCSGKYIALCDGDDYWTDPLKLQKQVDFLEKHSDVVLCFHPVKVLKNNELTDDFITKEYEAITDRIHLISYGNYIHTPSVVFRNVINAFPPAMYKAPAADYLLYVLLSEKGKIARLDETMAVYRHGSGLFSTLQREQMLNNTIRTYRCILQVLNREERLIMENRIKELMKLKLEMIEVDLKSDELKRELMFSDGFLVKHITFKMLFRSIIKKVFGKK